MLYIIGLGLYDEKDITLKGLEVLKKCKKIYAEFYTNLWHGRIENLEELAGNKIKILNRKIIEETPDEFLNHAKTEDTALLIPGDPMAATTHIDIVLRAEKLGIKVKIIHSSSIFSAVGEAGMQLYKFGKTTSIVFPEKNYFPESPYDSLRDNLKMNLHTLLLLDVKYDENKYMTVNDGIEILLQIEEKKSEGVFTKKTLCVGCARLGGDEIIKFGTAEELMKVDFGKPPHVLIVPAKLHFVEEEALLRFKI